jgi:hypothetical protein
VLVTRSAFFSRGGRVACVKGNPMRDEGPQDDVRLVEHALPLFRD